jgi:Leucine-rich repeat (LRR) protein
MLLVAGLFASGAPASEPFKVNFRDANLEAAIRTALDQPTGDILDTSLLTLTTLNASYRDIQYLDGIEFCSRLRQLQLHGNQIEDISALAYLTVLQDLYLWNNKVEDISALAALLDLRFLFLQDNQIEDITALGQNTGLASGDVVNLTGNPINQNGLCNVVNRILRPKGVTVYVTYECGTVVVNIPDPNLETELRRAIHKTTGDIYDTDLSGLTSFSAPHTGITDLTGIEYCKNLRSLDLAGNRIEDITLIGGLGKLTALYLGGNQIHDLSPLVQAYGLAYLELQDQHTLDGTKVLKDLEGLQFLGGLVTLYLHDNAISDIGNLLWLLNLQTLSLGNNQISDVSILEGIDTLQWLDLGGNNLEDDDMFSISRLTNLNHLGLWKNQIKSIDRLGSLNGLVYLDLSDNQIEVIDALVGLNKLHELYLDNNAISSTAALAGLPDLAVLALRHNSISDISPLAANTGIGNRPTTQQPQDRLDIRDNQLSQEDLCNEIPLLLKRDVQVSFTGTCCSESFAMTTAVNGSGTVSPAPGVRRFCAGDTVQLMATPADDWEFEGWEGDVTGSDPKTSVVMNADIRVTAVFRNTAVKYTLTSTVEPEGSGYVTATGSSPYSSGTLVTVTAVANDGWLFDHWEGNLDGRSNPKDIPMDADKLVRAVFKEQPPKYTLTTVVFPAGKGTTDPAEGEHQYTDGDGVRVTAHAVAGWAFDHWEEDLTGSTNPNTVAMTSDKTVVAVFKKKYTLSMAIESTGTTEPPLGDTEPPVGDNTTVDGKPIVDGSEVLVRAIPATAIGWVFDHWEGDLQGSVNPQTIVMNGNKQVTAVFKRDAFDYTLAMTVEGLGTTVPAPGCHRYLDGDSVVVRANPADAYVFDHWSGSLTGEDNPVTLKMDSDKTVQAVFTYALVTYVLTTSVEGGGRVSPSEGQRRYAEGKQVTLVATPDLGWTLDHWEGDVGGSASVMVLTMTSDKTAKAVFRKSPVITAISPDRGSIAGGESVSILGLQLTTTTSVVFRFTCEDDTCHGVTRVEDGICEREATIVSVSDTAVEIETPENTEGCPNPRGAVDVVVVTPDPVDPLNNPPIETEKAAGYTFIDAPAAPELGVATPNRGSVSGGDTVLIRGRNLALAYSVTFGVEDVEVGWVGEAATIVGAENTRLYVISPPHDAGTVDIMVWTPSDMPGEGQSATAPNAFTYVIKPEIQSLNPTQGTIAGGETVTIFGIGLDDPSQVLFGTEEAKLTSSDQGQITVVTPANAEGPADIIVTTAGGTAALLRAFDYYGGAGTLECTVRDELTQRPIAGATVRLESSGPSATTDANGFCVLNNIRPGDYLLLVSASSYALQVKAITLQRDELAAQTILMRTAIVSDGGCAPFLKSLDAKVMEKVLPLSVQESASETGVAPTSTLAIRLTEADGVDPASVWAVVEDEDTVLGSGGTWRPVVSGDDRDGWVLFTLTEMPRAARTVKMTIGAVTTTGSIVDPVSQDFRINADKQSTAGDPTLSEEGGVPALPLLLAAAKSSVYRIGPSGVFTHAVAVQIPVTSGLNPDDLEIYYYSESSAHAGWFRGDNVIGWMAPESRRTAVVDGQTCIEIQVNHSGVLQLGQALKVRLGSALPIELSAAGSRMLWIAFGLVIAALSALWGRLAFRGRRV